jgi:hypothetical protein
MYTLHKRVMPRSESPVLWLMFGFPYLFQTGRFFRLGEYSVKI